MLHSKLELVALVNAASGAQLGGVLSGAHDLVERGPLLLRMAPYERYACVHTHPDGGSFSPEDAALVVRFRAVCVITAVGGQGTWYVLSPDPDHMPGPPNEVYATYKQTFDALGPKCLQLVQAGALTRLEAQRQHTHEVWIPIAAALGLRYDRVT